MFILPLLLVGSLCARHLLYVHCVFVWSHNCVPWLVSLPFPHIGPDVLSRQCQISQNAFLFSLPQLLFILISSQYSSLLDHPLISFSSFGPLVGVLQYWANQSCKLYTLIFCPLFYFCEVWGLALGPFCRLSQCHSSWNKSLEMSPGIWQSRSTVLYCRRCFWVQLFKTHCGILARHCAACVLHYSPTNEWMNECLVLQQSRCRIGFLKWRITLVYLYQNRVHLCVCVCTCVLFL